MEFSGESQRTNRINIMYVQIHLRECKRCFAITSVYSPENREPGIAGALEP